MISRTMKSSHTYKFHYLCASLIPHSSKTIEKNVTKYVYLLASLIKLVYGLNLNSH